MQEKGKKKIIDNAGALQKKYAWKSEKQKKKPAAVCPYAKKCGGCDYQGMSYEQQLQEKQTYVRKTLRGITVKSCRSSEWKIRIITEIKCTQCLMWSAGENMQTEAGVPQKRTCKRHRAA